MWRVVGARWGPLRAATLISSIQHNTACGATLGFRIENVFISTRWPNWEAVRNFPKGKFLALSLDRWEAAEPGHFIYCYLLALSELSSRSCGAVHVHLAGLICWLHFSFPMKGFLLCKLPFVKTTYCSECLGYTINHAYLTWEGFCKESPICLVMVSRSAHSATPV